MYIASNRYCPPLNAGLVYMLKRIDARSSTSGGAWYILRVHTSIAWCSVLARLCVYQYGTEEVV